MNVVLNYIIDRQENNGIDLQIYLFTFLHFQLKQKDVTELLARADDLSTQNKSYQEVKHSLSIIIGYLPWANPYLDVIPSLSNLDSRSVFRI